MEKHPGQDAWFPVTKPNDSRVKEYFNGITLSRAMGFCPGEQVPVNFANRSKLDTTQVAIEDVNVDTVEWNRVTWVRFGTAAGGPGGFLDILKVNKPLRRRLEKILDDFTYPPGCLPERGLEPVEEPSPSRTPARKKQPRRGAKTVTPTPKKAKTSARSSTTKKDFASEVEKLSCSPANSRRSAERDAGPIIRTTSSCRRA